MLEINLKVENIDYNSLVDKLLPLIAENYRDDGSVLGMVLNKTKGMQSSMAKAALSVMPQEKKDELAASLLMKYRSEIIDLLARTARENGVSMDIRDLSIDKE